MKEQNLIDPAHTARMRRLGVQVQAVELLDDADVIDLHIDTFIPVRLWGHNLFADHGQGPLRGRFFGHLDLPRMQLGGLTGAMWSLTTNPFRFKQSRWRVFQQNLTHFQQLVAQSHGKLRIVRNVAEYAAAKAVGAQGVFVSIQGGNALQDAPQVVDYLKSSPIVRVTLVHLTDSIFGASSSPLSLNRRGGLSDHGHDFVQQLNAAKVFVDLAHIRHKPFWDAVAAHDGSQPLIATHTGVSGVRPHWRNLDDAQLKAIAATGGVIGIIFASNFLQRKGGPRDLDIVIEHLEHICRVVGEEFAAIGSDYDGAIVPPADLRDGLGYARLVQRMLDLRWPEAKIRAIVGGNALRAIGLLRP